ncbi:MAG: radical SAM protein [Candidatus Omnitrophica bacterium]|nr:radical SAM protein [Candidatus Omnitrophota bacterium]
MLISWNITKACNLKCEHCYRDAGYADKNELDFEEGKSLLADIAALKVKALIFSGGEPLLRKGLFDLISFASKIGLTCVLGTNGTLIDRQAARKLEASGLKRAGISLDSCDQLKHDKFRCFQGAWGLAVSAMNHCRDAGLDFQVHTTVTKKNIGEILNITDFAKDVGAKAHHIFFLVATGRGKNIDDVIPSAAEYESLLNKILEKQNGFPLELKPVCAPQFMRISRQKKIHTRFDKGCLAGISYACILPNGDVHPCAYMPLRLGNVREIKFSQIWSGNNKILCQLRSRQFYGKCGLCEYKNICSGCRAAAFYQSNGDFLAEDPNCVYEPKREKNSKKIAI